MIMLLLVLTFLFALLSCAGAAYVVRSGGELNAGYAVIPMLFMLVCLQGHLLLRRRGDSK